jgi:hypothetical protein
MEYHFDLEVLKRAGFRYDSADTIIEYRNEKRINMGDKGKKDKGKREEQKKSKHTPKEKRKQKIDKKNAE